MNCKNCIHYLPYESPIHRHGRTFTGTCHRYPPGYHVYSTWDKKDSQYCTESMEAWPDVAEDDFCGEFKCLEEIK